MHEAKDTDGPPLAHLLVKGLVAQDPELISQLDTGDDVTARILTAAREQIETVGWRRSTIEDIAKRARLGRATVYRKFPSKQVLLDAVIDAGVREYLAGSTAAVTNQPTIEDRIAESTRFTVEFLRNHPILTRLIETEPETVLPLLTVDAGPLIQLVDGFSVAVWHRELYDGNPMTDKQRQHLQIVAELHTRLTLSFILTKNTAIPLDTPEQTRTFARNYLAPMLLGLIDADRSRSSSGLS